MRAFIGRAAAVGGIAAGGWLLGAGVAAAGPGPAEDVPARVSMSTHLTGVEAADETSGRAEAASAAEQIPATGENSPTPVRNAPAPEISDTPRPEAPYSEITASEDPAPGAGAAEAQVAASTGAEPGISEPHVAEPDVRPVRVQRPRVTVPEVAVRTNPAEREPGDLPPDDETSAPVPGAEPTPATGGADDLPAPPAPIPRQDEHRTLPQAHPAPQHLSSRVASSNAQQADPEPGDSTTSPADWHAQPPAPDHDQPPAPIPATPMAPAQTAGAASSPGIGQGLRALHAVMPDHPRLPGPARAVRGHFETVALSGVTPVEPSASPD